MSKHHTQPILHSKIMEFLRTWYNTGTPSVSYSLDSAVMAAMQEQADIGGFNFVLGRVSKQISAIQHHHLQQCGSQLSGTSWTALFISQLWELNRTMWEHRNSVKHSNDNPDTKASHAELVDRVLQELEIGTATLLPRDRYLLPSSEHKLQARTCPQLRQLLESIHQARRRYQHVTAAQQQQMAQQQDTMANWLKSGSALNSQQRAQIEGLQLDPNEEIPAYWSDDESGADYQSHSDSQGSSSDDNSAELTLLPEDHLPESRSPSPKPPPPPIELSSSSSETSSAQSASTDLFPTSSSSSEDAVSEYEYSDQSST